MQHRATNIRRAAHSVAASPSQPVAASASTTPTGHSFAVTFLLAALLPGVASAQSRPHFLTPTEMPAPVNMAGSCSYSIALSADGLRAMVETDRAGGRGGRDIFLLQRPTAQSSFTSNGPMGFCGPYDEGGGQYSPNNQGGLFSSNRSGGMGGYDVVGFGQGTPSALNSPWDDTDPSLTDDGLWYFFTSNRPGSLGGKSIWQSTRASVNDAWRSPVPVTSIDSANHEQSPSLTDDGLILFFSSNRDGNFDIYAATRSSTQSQFGAPVRVAELSSPNHDIGIEIAALQEDVLALVTVMINGRAVILSAEQDGTVQLALAGTEHLRTPAGQVASAALGAPLAPHEVGIGVRAVDPGAVTMLAALDHRPGDHPEGPAELEAVSRSVVHRAGP